MLLTFKHKRFQGLIWLCRSVSSTALISSASYAGGFMSRYLLAIGVVTVSHQIISTFTIYGVKEAKCFLSKIDVDQCVEQDHDTDVLLKHPSLESVSAD